MSDFVDARVPVRFGSADEAGPDSALLIENDGPLPPGRPAACFTVPRVFGPRPHAAGCRCCTPRTSAAQALSRLFLARARREVAFFRDVLVVISSTAGQTSVLSALADDPLVSAWFRVSSDQSSVS
ncbi:MAG TPA: hypothetical protein VLI93_14840 [Acetobacteraceae bacterium]|nr:hypothetical protein [Acetobacteraceae bacterium]